MAKAIWNGTVIAESERTELVEGNQYFPPEDVRLDLFTHSGTHTVCPWKGTASYYNLERDGKITKDAAWYYPETKPDADHIRGYIAFYRTKGIQIE